MSKKLFLLCPLIHGEVYLRNRFGNESFFMTALGSVFDFHNMAYVDSLIHLLLQEDITEIFHVHDINSPLLRSIVNEEVTYNSISHQFLSELYKENYCDVIQEPNKVASLALIHMKHQVNLFLRHPRLSAIIIENKISIQGLLSQIDKRKSIQFDIQMDFQQL
ncbi:hypothetical protein [Aquiflexum gelatinilyticum]|uniref:hypothetical protein n=1 Tax=Aquiflexum gelatinilyticum TaxID=2961943 RepID=UPI0021692B6F|nr:hypothetical protein [Aquiflexum gelatinilyticum]MCS4436399.1 hypothetical protein [Aquiflexum gelatinilyticum]